MLETDKQPLAVFSKYAILIFMALLFAAGYLIWQMWPSLIMASMQWQKQINAQLSDLLYDAQAHSLSAGISLIGLSFIYGVLHSIGPGHGKVIVSTYIATHPSKVKITLMLTILSALLQAVVAIALVSALLVIFQSSMHEVNGEANRLVTLSFYAVVLLGLVIILRALHAIYTSSSFSTKKIHDSDCHCCNGKHFIDGNVISNASSYKEYLMIILSVGMRPCTGAIMVLLFANLMNIYWLGMVSAIVMAIGTALTTSTIAIMTITGKKLITHYINAGSRQINSAKREFVRALLRITGGVILTLMGVVLLNSQPVVGISPIF